MILNKQGKRMPGKILGIDISEHNISVVQIMSSLKGFQIISCFSTPIIENNLEKAIEELSSGIDLKSDRCLLTIPPSNIFFRNIETPFTDNKKIRQTLPFELETLAPFNVDSKIIDYIRTDEGSPSGLFTAAADRELIAAYIDLFKKTDIDPDVIDIRPLPAVTWLMDQEHTPDSGIYLDFEPGHTCLVLFQNKKIRLLRELSGILQGPETEETSDEDDNSSQPLEFEVSDSNLEKICRETARTVHSFCSGINSNFSIEKIFYGGSLSENAEISQAIGRFFEITSQKINVSRDSRLKIEPEVTGSYKPLLMDTALASAINENKKNKSFNFRRNEFAVKRRIFGPGKDIRKIAVLGTVLLILLFINTGMDYYNLSKKHSMYEESFNSKFDKKLPDKKAIKGSRARFATINQMISAAGQTDSQDLEGINTDQKVLDILEDIYLGINDYKVQVERITIESKEVKIFGNTDTYDTVTQLEIKLMSSDYFKKVEIINQELERDKSGIRFTLALERSE